MEEMLTYAILLSEQLVPESECIAYGNIQNIEPFQALCYADDSLSWGDEDQTKNIYEYALNYYKGSHLSENKIKQ